MEKPIGLIVFQQQNCLLQDAIKGQMTEVKGIVRITQLLDDLINKRRYWELREEADNRQKKNWKRHFFTRI